MYKLSKHNRKSSQAHFVTFYDTPQQIYIITIPYLMYFHSIPGLLSNVQVFVTAAEDIT